MRARRILSAAFVASALAACSPDDGRPDGPIPIVVLEAAADGGDAGAPAPKGLGEPCSLPTDCASGACFIGGQAAYCSLKCTTDDAATVCAPPTFNGACNKQGYCKKP